MSLGGGAGQQNNELCDAQDTSLPVSGIIQNDDIVTKDITPNLHKESPTETSSVQDKSNQDPYPINESNQDKSIKQVHPEEHSAIEFDQVESYSCMKLTAILHLESQERVGSEIAESIQVESVDQVNVQIEDLLLSENLDNSKVSIPVNSEAIMIQQESVIPGIAASSSTKVSFHTQRVEV